MFLYFLESSSANSLYSAFCAATACSSNSLAASKAALGGAFLINASIRDVCAITAKFIFSKEPAKLSRVSHISRSCGGKLLKSIFFIESSLVGAVESTTMDGTGSGSNTAACFAGVRS